MLFLNRIMVWFVFFFDCVMVRLMIFLNRVVVRFVLFFYNKVVLFMWLRLLLHRKVFLFGADFFLNELVLLIWSWLLLDNSVIFGRLLLI